MLPTKRTGWVGGRVALVLLIATPLLASDVPLFPVPLHFVRRLEDPISGVTTDVDEYCTGNKIITVRGERTAIADYEGQQLIEIDRAASTYSVATFEDISRARSLAARPAPAKQNPIASDALRPTWKTSAHGVRSSQSGRSADSFEISSDNVKVDLAVDRQITLSRAALDALSGASYPNKPDAQQDAIARACARTSDAQTQIAGDGSYGLPLEQSITVDADAKTHLTVRNSIVKITSELPPPELIAIPAGAALVESRAARMVKTLSETEHAPPPIKH